MPDQLSPEYDIKSHIIQESRQWISNSRIQDNKIFNLTDFCSVISQWFKGGNWLFRGEPKLFDKPLVPSIFREEHEFTRTLHPNNSITDQEIKEVQSCQSSHNDGAISDRYLAAFIPNMHLHDVNWLPLARHFGYKTRLLDVTYNPLVALYFACIEKHEGEIEENDDAFVYAFQKNNYRPVNSRNTEQRNSSDYPPIPINYLDLYDVDMQFLDCDFNELPYLFEPSTPQERLQAQAGCFLFWRDLRPVLYKRQIIPIRINAAEKESLLNELTAFGITKNVLFPSENV